ncbi:MAG: NAD(P)/FAD-dependent oxidoreductase [Rubrivivax sp.]|nr:NAD(P)/FAD-dependent oxidoreductase [Rubrivivax sp.]
MTTAPSRFSRRQVVGIGLAAGAASLVGCAAPSASARPRVVVVGGGWGGLGAARTLARSGEVDVVLVEPNEAFMSCPLSVHYIAGLQPASDFQRSYAAVDRAGVRRVRERALAIDRAGSAVVTASGRLPYDFLVLSPGIEYDEQAIAGYAQAREQLPVGFRAFEQMAVRAQVERFLASGGTYVISVPKPPYRCPPAPYERAFLIAEQMRRRNVKGKIVIVDANPAPTPPPIAKPIQAAMKGLYGNEIEYVTQTDIGAVDIGRRRVTTTMGELPFTEANLVLPMRAPALLREAGLAERWAAVRLPSFQSQTDDKVYVVGDAQGSPLPKSGHVAFGAGVQVARDIQRRIAGQPAPAPTGPVSLPAGICWASVTHDEAIMISVGATIVPGEAPKLGIQVDAVHNKASGTGAVEWGRTMWNNMLG